jgi:DNA-binding GntR family transcriptional regulator
VTVRRPLKRTLRIVDSTPLVRDHALERLRLAITTGRYRPGARLVERELCDALGVSRTSIREALRQLQSEHLVEASDYSGSRVAAMSAADAADLYTLREMLETEAVRRFVAHASPADVRKLERVHREMQKALGRDNPAQLAQIAGQFYETILAGAGSRIMQEVARHLLARVDYLRYRSMVEPGRLDAGLSEWDAIVDALMARDGDAAAAAMSRHLRNAREAIVARLLAEEEEASPAPVPLSGARA